MDKKLTIKEFNQKYFVEWKEIDKVVPIFEEWFNQDEEEESKETHIKEIEIWFKNGDKVAFVPYSNKSESTLDDEDNPLCCAIQIIEYQGKPINWKVEK